MSMRDAIIANAKPFVSLWTISTPIYPTFQPEHGPYRRRPRVALRQSQRLG